MKLPFVRIYILLLLFFPVSLALIALSFLTLMKPVTPIVSSAFIITNPFIEQAHAQDPIVTPSIDIRVAALRLFFNKYKSPLAAEADYLVQSADLWGLDYALIPAIAMQESQGCKRIPENSYNCWGFGIYGDKVTRFASYKEAIMQIAKTIRLSYINKGKTNATLVEDIWAPPSRGQWSYSVNFFIGKIKEFEKSSPAS